MDCRIADIQGVFIRAQFTSCRCQPNRLDTFEAVRGILAEAVASADMTAVNTVGHNFSPRGYTYCVVLAESHLVVHTYPEQSNSVLVELSVCHYQRNNEVRAHQLIAHLQEIFSPAVAAVRTEKLAV